MKFYFSFRSPYSWMAAHRLAERGLGSDSLRFIPWWEPRAEELTALQARGGDVLYTPMSKAKLLYALQDVRRQTAKLGLSLRWPVDKNSDWSIPHHLYLALEGSPLSAPFFAAVHRRRWLEGGDVWSWASMGDILRSLGEAKDPQALASTPAVREKALAALAEAHMDGLFGVPFFVSGFHRFWGVDRLDDFLALQGYET